MIKVTVHVILFVVFSLRLTAQDFNYVHYDTKDGLAGATVYDMCQDIDGFLWFATENGLSRYDGGNFKNFTVKDGLPDNEVLKVFSDSKGRTWIGTFNKELCYYYKGKIYTRQNDTLLKKIALQGILLSAAETTDGTIALSDIYKIIILPPEKADVLVFSVPGRATVTSFTSCTGQKILAANDLHDLYLYNTNKRKFENFTSIPPHLISSGSSPNSLHVVSQSCDGRQYKWLPQKSGYINALSKNNATFFVNTTNGAWEIDTINIKWGNHYLQGKQINKILIDSEGNKWFSANGEGVYKLSSTDTKTTLIPSAGSERNTEVFTIFKHNKTLMAGLNMGKAASFKAKHLIKVTNYTDVSTLELRHGVNRLYSVKEISDNVALLGFDHYLVKLQNSKPVYNYLYPIKSIEIISKDYVLVGTSSLALKIQLKDLKVVDTIWKERCTKVFYCNGKYYIGTLNGLYEISQSKTNTAYLGNIHQALTRRIVDIKATADNTLWIATADQGVVAYKNNKVLFHITDSNGLSSDICKTLFLHKNYLWVGTNKGINKINLAVGSLSFIKYNMSDGLPSDLINAIYVEDSIVYAGTPAGLTWFNESKISGSSICKLTILNVTTADTAFNSVNNILSHKNPGIRFEYVAVSVKSAGEIEYYYRLNGLSEKWNQTTQNIIDFKALPSGRYELELYAVNKFGEKSNTEKIQFFVSTPFWKTTWFFVFIIIAVAAITGLIVNKLNKLHQQKLKTKSLQQKQFAALEQQALQAQMNPHFIFNCLNGIQQYILTGDKEKANEYLTCFARLIRQTLDNSGKKTISVAQEVEYLKEYLEMEKMRSANVFTSEFIIDSSINADAVEIPAMLLQPYVENALRHGLRYKKNGAGHVQISVIKKGGNLLCIVKDNGVGRKYAAEIKSTQHIEYQSKGMSLTARRIDLLNKMNDTKLAVTVNDLYDNTNAAAGTEVIIQIPV